MNSTWLLILLILTVLIGFRYEVGGDWANYLRYITRAYSLDFADLRTLDDPGYWALNILSLTLGFGMTGVNTLGAFIFSIGLVVFCRSTPRPWLALACAQPYLVTVVAMGYTRQSIALGLAMIGLVMLGRGRFVVFIVWVLLGALFHKTAVMLLPIAAFSSSRNRWLSLGIIISATLLGYKVLLEDSAVHLVQTYTDQSIASSGALVRLSMNLLPAILFLFYRYRFLIAASERNLWSVFSLLAVGMFVVFFPSNLSTPLDRLALYVLPLQLTVFSHLPDALGVFGKRNQVVIFAILIYYALAMYVWLNFAVHSRYWVPYQLGVA
ncbi:MAG: EpsG family protein [Sulfitobacter sp.]